MTENIDSTSAIYSNHIINNNNKFKRPTSSLVTQKQNQLYNNQNENYDQHQPQKVSNLVIPSIFNQEESPQHSPKSEKPPVPPRSSISIPNNNNNNNTPTTTPPHQKLDIKKLKPPPPPRNYPQSSTSPRPSSENDNNTENGVHQNGNTTTTRKLSIGEHILSAELSFNKVTSNSPSPPNLFSPNSPVYSSSSTPSSSSSSPNNESPSMGSPTNIRRSTRHSLLTRKVASLDLLSDEDSSSSSSSPPSSTISPTISDENADGNSDQSSSNLTNSNDSIDTQLNQISHQKKKSFFLRNPKEKSEIIDPKDIILEKILDKKLTTPRKLDLPPIDQNSNFNKVLNEMIETEADYLEDLEIIIEYYLFAMVELEKYKIVSAADISSLFSNVEELYEINKIIFNNLKNTIPILEKGECPNVDQIFFYVANKLQRYSLYLVNQEICLKTLKNVEKITQANYLFNQIKSIPIVKNLNLNSYLIKPVQRLCKYPLLLRELRKSVPEDDVFHRRDLERAAKLMEQIVSNINGRISNEEKIKHIKEQIGRENHDVLIGKKLFIQEEKVNLIKEKSNREYPIPNGLDISYTTTVFNNTINNSEESQTPTTITETLTISTENYARKLLLQQEIEDIIHAYRALSGSLSINLNSSFKL
eukprot:gene701-864_t